MAKDPAFLFYYQDFLVGTEFMTFAERGIYITMLCHQADKGSLTAEHMLSICKAHAFTDILKSKFRIDENGHYFNERLLLELQKRRNYTESRRKNAKAYAKHMGNVNENENKDVSKNKKQKKRFVKPSFQDVVRYCEERNSSVDPQYFYDRNEGVGWVDKNGNLYKDWKAVIRTWEKYGKPKPTMAQQNTAAGMKRLEEQWENEERGI